ncbi:MAG TPA: serine/threonine-protein kinase [Candidatus Thermoplasmatota archaeon]|nr:serine/threonine-protein kinase [Candidatus Thermoplasmatota archaeon]
MHPAIALAWVAFVLTMAMSVVVLAAAPARPTNRRLSVVFFLHAVAIAIWVLAAHLPVKVSVALGRTSTLCLLTVPILYLWFLSTLDAPLARRLRHPTGQVILALLLAGFLLPVFLFRSTFETDTLQAWFGGGYTMATSKAMLVLLQSGVPVYALALAITIQAYRRALAGTAAKDRAFWFMVGFGVHDLFFGYRLIVLLPYLADGNAIPPGWVGPTIQYGRPLSLIGWVLLLSYGMLRHQLFDLEVRIRRGAVRTALVATLVGLFFVAGSLASRALESRGSNLLALGVVAVAAIALLPLQRSLDRVLDRLLPGPTQAELDARKLQVFGAALAEVAAADGAVAPRDLARLDELQRDLGLTTRDREVLARALRPSPSAPGLRPGQLVLDRYTLRRPLDGPAARTWLATAEGGHEVVVKRSPLVAGGLREKVALARLQHRNVVALLDAGDDPAGSFVVLEHATGGSLAARLAGGPLGRDEWNRLAKGLLGGLAVLHGRGILHRDLKPANVLLGSDGRAIVADFDVAHLGGLDVTVGPPAAPPVGTLRYMAPEQARGQPASSSSDVFGAAATLYEALAGHAYLPVRAGESAAELRQRASAARTFPAALPQAPELRDWFAKALDPVPERRFPSVKAMRGELAHLQGRQGTSTRASWPPAPTAAPDQQTWSRPRRV